MSDDRYHDDARCGACSGPLDVHRDAICEKCAPTSEYFEMAARVQELSEALQKDEAGGPTG